MRVTSAADSSSRCRGGPASPTAPVPDGDDTVDLLPRLAGRALKDVRCRTGAGPRRTLSPTLSEAAAAPPLPRPGGVRNSARSSTPNGLTCGVTQRSITLRIISIFAWHPKALAGRGLKKEKGPDGRLRQGAGI